MHVDIRVGDLPGEWFTVIGTDGTLTYRQHGTDSRVVVSAATVRHSAELAGDYAEAHAWFLDVLQLGGRQVPQTERLFEAHA